MSAFWPPRPSTRENVRESFSAKAGNRAQPNARDGLYGLDRVSAIPLLLGLLLLIAGRSSPLFAQEPAAERPNIVLIMADDLGDEVLGAYGGESFDTPNIDTLAESGTRFTHAFSTPVCSPSRTTILTGRYTFRYPHEWGHLPPDEITFGTILRDAGYATAAAGKWQMALLEDDPLHPVREGFNRYAFWAWHEGPRYYEPMIWKNGRRLHESVDHRYGPTLYTEFLLDHIRRNGGEHQRFLAYFPMTLPHFAKTGGPYGEPRGPDTEYQNYREMVVRMDRLVGAIVETLEREGLRENTLVLFTSDNGTPQRVEVEADDREVQGGKGKMTDAGTHVPLIASWPGHVPRGRTSDALIDLSDVMPTLADLAGTEPPQDRDIDGVSFAPQLLGSDEQHRPWVYTQWEGRRWARTQDWKLYGNGELYHVADDETEQSPIRAGEGGNEAVSVREALRAAFEQLGVDTN